MASSTGCKYVLVYTTDGVTLQTVTVLNGNIVLPSNAVIQSVTNFSASDSGCSISSTCNNLPTTTPTACYAFAFDVAGGGSGSDGRVCDHVTLLGMRINGIDYPFSDQTQVIVAGGESTIGTTITTLISNTDYLKDIISFSGAGGDDSGGSNIGTGYYYYFKTIPTLMQNSFLYYSCNRENSNYPIYSPMVPIATYNTMTTKSLSCS